MWNSNEICVPICDPDYYVADRLGIFCELSRISIILMLSVCTVLPDVCIVLVNFLFGGFFSCMLLFPPF